MSDALNNALAELRREYLFEAPGRLAELRKDVAAFRAGEPDASLSLLRRFHRLAGSGGSYGLQDISQIAREGEAVLAKPVDNVGIASARLEKLVDRLAETFDAAAIGLGLPARGPAVTEFGWRSVVVVGVSRLRGEVVAWVVNAGFLVR